MAAAVGAIQAVVNLRLVTVAAGDQQVANVRQQFFCTLIGAALWQFSQNACLRQIGRGDGGSREQAFANGKADVVLAQRAAAAGAQHRVADQRRLGQALHQLQHGVDHLDRAQHAQLDR